MRLRLVYIPSMGFYTSIASPQSDYDKKDGITMKFKSTKDNCVYFSTPITDFLNSRIGDIVSQMALVQKRVLLAMQRAILGEAADLIDFSHFIANVDCVLTLALAAKSYNLVRPHITDGDSENNNEAYISISGT